MCPIDKSSDEYGDEIEQNIQDQGQGSKLLTKEGTVYRSGIKRMRNCGVNKYIQAILQVYVSINQLAKYFMDKKYKEVCNDGDEQPYCEAIHEMFINNFSESMVVEGIQENNIIHMLFLMSKDFRKSKPQDAWLLFNHLIEKLNIEIRFDVNKPQEKYHESSLVIKQVFGTKLRKDIKCENGHVESQIITKLPEFDMDSRDVFECL